MSHSVHPRQPQRGRTRHRTFDGGLKVLRSLGTPSRVKYTKEKRGTSLLFEKWRPIVYTLFINKIYKTDKKKHQQIPSSRQEYRQSEDRVFVFEWYEKVLKILIITFKYEGILELLVKEDNVLGHGILNIHFVPERYNEKPFN